MSLRSNPKTYVAMSLLLSGIGCTGYAGLVIVDNPGPRFNEVLRNSNFRTGQERTTAPKRCAYVACVV